MRRRGMNYIWWSKNFEYSPYWSKHMCGPFCRGECPCPLPSWQWKCNSEETEIVSDPQKKFVFDPSGDTYLGCV